MVSVKLVLDLEKKLETHIFGTSNKIFVGEFDVKQNTWIAVKMKFYEVVRKLLFTWNLHLQNLHKISTASFGYQICWVDEFLPSCPTFPTDMTALSTTNINALVGPLTFQIKDSLRSISHIQIPNTDPKTSRGQN